MSHRTPLTDKAQFAFPRKRALCYAADMAELEESYQAAKDILSELAATVADLGDDGVPIEILDLSDQARAFLASNP